jgi:CheY-like chemotaxis protein
MIRILVIDDEPSVRNVIRSALTWAGHSVAEAGDGATALAALRTWVPELVVCDLFMPGSDGLDTIWSLRQVAPKVPIIAISGGGRWSPKETLDEAVALGANVGLAKPFRPGDLLQVIGTLLGAVPGRDRRPAPAPPRPAGAARTKAHPVPGSRYSAG